MNSFQETLSTGFCVWAMRNQRGRRSASTPGSITWEGSSLLKPPLERQVSTSLPHPLWRHKYRVSHLQNILDINLYTALMSEGKKSPHSSCSWFKECVIQVKIWVCQDCTTTNDNLHEKAKNYALNFLASNTELSINKDDVAREVADVVEKAFQKKCFDQRTPAYVMAQKERKKIPEDPEKKFIKLRP